MDWIIEQYLVAFGMLLWSLRDSNLIPFIDYGLRRKEIRILDKLF